MEAVLVIVSSDIKVGNLFVWSSIHELRGRVHMRAHLVMVVRGSIPLASFQASWWMHMIWLLCSESFGQEIGIM